MVEMVAFADAVVAVAGAVAAAVVANEVVSQGVVVAVLLLALYFAVDVVPYHRKSVRAVLHFLSPMFVAVVFVVAGYVTLFALQGSQLSLQNRIPLLQFCICVQT